MRVALLLLVVGVCAEAEAQAVKPYLRIETGTHTARARSIDVDAAERFLVSASDDKTARVWDLPSGRLLKILRPPIGEGKEGILYAVAFSPDGTTLAVGGFTGAEGAETQPIYIFDRESGTIRKTIQGLPNVTNHLAYSRDGRYLGASLGTNGIRIFKTATYSEAARDTEYGASSYWLEFDRSGRVVTTSSDGFVRVYNPQFHLLHREPAPHGKQPISARFSPDGKLIAVGFADHPTVDVLSAEDLSFQYALRPPLGGGNLVSTSWSVDGGTLCAAGSSGLDAPLVFCWSDRGKLPNSFRAAADIILDIRAVHGGMIAFCDGNGAVGLLGPREVAQWIAAPDLLDYRGGVRGVLPLRRGSNPVRLSLDGNDVQVDSNHYDGSMWTWKRHQVSFSVSDQILQIDTEPRLALQPPATTGLAIDLGDPEHPRLDSRVLALRAHETSNSLAVSPNKDSFVLATTWYLRKFDRLGKQVWGPSVPGAAFNVNISADGRFVVAALGDGTVRWYSFDKGEEVLALFVDSDLKRWVAWNPDGFFSFQGGGDGLIGYQINRGPGHEGAFVKVDQLREVFYQPDLIAQVLKPGGAEAFVAARNRIGDISKILSSGLPPKIELISPAEATVEGDYVLRFRVKDMGGGLGRIVYRVDGREIEGRGGVDIAGTGGDVISRSIPLATGTHTVDVAGYNRGGNIESPPTSARVTRNVPAVAGNLYVIAAGITHYKDHSLWEGVRFASADADLIKAQFKKQEGKGLYRKVNAVSLPDSQATITNIQNALTQAAKTAQPADTFVLYLAGHGEAVSDRYYFIPWEAENTNQGELLKESLSGEKIRELLRQIHTTNSLLILDTCGAGAYLEHRGAGEKGALDKLALMSGNTVFAASDTKEMAVEGYENHGVFTFALLKGLEEAQGNKNGDVLIDSLGVYLRNKVPGITEERWHLMQSPQIDYQGAPFPIARKLAY